MSDLRVFVTFPRSATVFAGELLECEISFANVAPVRRPPASAPHPPLPLGSPLAPAAAFPGRVDRRPKVAPLQLPAADRRLSRVSPRLQQGAFQPTTNHRPNLSLTVADRPAPSPVLVDPAAHKHKRSVSIISLGSDVGAISAAGRGGGEQTLDGLRTPPSAAGRLPPARKHERSSSMQVLPRRGSAAPSTPTTAHSTRPSTPSDAMATFSFPRRTSTPGTPGTPRTPRSAKPPIPRSATAHKAFKFPPGPPTPDGSSDQSNKIPPNIPLLRSPMEADAENGIAPGRVISAHSIQDTPRSSNEFYTLSNSTTETLVSEYSQVATRPGRSASTPTHIRRYSLLSLGPRSSSGSSDSNSDSLMMGYAHVSGSFVLDGSLVDTSVFEDVKQKGVAGGQMGGGVVGIASQKSGGGFLSGFGWGGFGNNLSSIAELKTITSSRSIPILTTPRSILFVDLQLGPGESKSYSFKFALPQGLPPSHKGKAIKITYHIVVGTQRPNKGVQQPNVVEIPFRVLPHVNPNGTLPSHNLMSPTILLRDEATVTALEKPSAIPTTTAAAKLPPKKRSSLEDFFSYVDALLAPAVDEHDSILSPTFHPTHKSPLYDPDEPPVSALEAIDMAVLRGGGPESLFEIARNGQRVARVTLGRPAYKVGETISCSIDFSSAQIPTRHLNASLESSETVNSALALRSAASIHRATRRIYTSHSESTLFSRRIPFTPTIPASATPSFTTSGAALTWVLRLEFVTPALVGGGTNGSAAPVVHEESLLELSSADERGDVLHARQAMRVESFDAAIPIRVYPNSAEPAGGGDSQAVAAAVQGFAI